MRYEIWVMVWGYVYEFRTYSNSKAQKSMADAGLYVVLMCELFEKQLIHKTTIVREQEYDISLEKIMKIKIHKI